MVQFEADNERRKLGLPHRVNFLGRSSLEPEYTQTEEVELHRQNRAECATAIFQLHVSYYGQTFLITLFFLPLQAYTYYVNFPTKFLLLLFLSCFLPMQESIRDKLRPISLSITHTIKHVPPRRNSAKRAQKLPPVLNISPSNKLHSEVCNKNKGNQALYLNN